MKILMINDNGVERGGIETYMLNSKYELEKKGHIVKIFSSDAYPEKSFFSDYKFKKINPCSIFRFIPYTFNFKSYYKLKKVLNKFKPDVVHIHNIFYHSSPSILAALKNTPAIMTFHSYEIICPMGTLIFPTLNSCKNSFSKNCIKCIGKMRYYPEKIKRIILRNLLKNIDGFIVPSNHIKKELEKRGFSSIKSIYNGINLLKYSNIKKDTHNLLFIGRLREIKGVEYLLRSLPKIIKNFPEVHLDVVGDGPEKQNLINLTNQLNIEKNITFVGQIPNNKINKYYKKSSIIMVPSIWPEPFGLIGPEAMSAGRPVIASNVGGIPEWLDDGKTGFLVPPKDADAIAEKVIYLLKRPKLMQKMGLAARKKAEKEFDIKKHVKEIEKVYQEVIEKYKSKSLSK